MENQIKIISTKLKGLRAENGYLMENVADKLGIHRETLRKYENNPSSMEIGMFLKLLNLYDVETTYFFDLVYGKMPNNELIKENIKE